MRALTVDGLAESGSFKNDAYSPFPGDSTITELQLYDSNISHSIRDLISSCANLEVFRYSHTDYSADYELEERFQPSLFFDSLASTRKSLRCLWLHHLSCHLSEDIEPDSPHNDWFGSLADFLELREVHMRLQNLLDIRPGIGKYEVATPLVDILPSSVEWLYIEDCKEKYIPILISQLRDLVSNRHTRVPHLVGLDIEGQFHHNPAPGEITLAALRLKPAFHKLIEPLRVACKEAGVEFIIRDFSCPDSMKNSPMLRNFEV